MQKKRLLTGTVAACALGFAALFMCDAAQAQSAKEKEIASRKGVSGSLGSKDIDEKKLPGTMEIGLAIGTTVASIAAIKWL